MIKKILSDEYFYIISLSVILVALISFGGSALPVSLQIMRAFLGLLFALFFPGYCLQGSGMPARSDLDVKERLALSFGLSLAIIPAAALILDLLPWGINLGSVTSIFLLIILIFSFLAIKRRARLPEPERFLLLKEIKWATGWRSLERSNRVAYILVGLVVLLMGLTAVSLLAVNRSADLMTEFYLLGPAGKGDSYPQTGIVGQPVTVTLGIRNLEGARVSYQVVARDASGVIGQMGSFEMEPGAVIEQPFTFKPVQTGKDVEIDFTLLRDDQTTSYRTLRLILNVKPES